jgi:hypothetical protein
MSVVHHLTTVGSDGALCTVTIYTIEHLPDDRGIWNTETNKVIITEKMYADFKEMTQRQQGMFFNSLKKITSSGEWALLCYKTDIIND